MKAVLKYAAIVVGAVAILIAAVAVIAPLVFDPNDYKPQITELVKERTGRELRIDGDIALTVFPWLGVRLGEVRLGNAPGFPEPYFARVGAMQVRVKLLPLVTGRVEMDTITVEGLQLDLARNEQGTTNWEDLAHRNNNASPAPAAPGADGAPIAAVALGGVDVRGAALRWSDARSGQTIRVANLDARTGAVSPGKPVEITLGFDVEGLAPGLGGRIETRAVIAADPQGQRIEATGLEISADLTGEAVPGGAKLRAKAARGVFEPAAQKASVEGLELVAEDVAVGAVRASASVRAGLDADLAAGVARVRDLGASGALSGDPLPGGRVPFELSGTVQADLNAQTVAVSGLRLDLPEIKQPEATGSLTVETAAAADLAARRVSLQGLDVRGRFSGPALPGGELPVALGADVLADLGADLVELTGLELSAGPMKGSGAVKITALTREPLADGEIALEEVNPRSLLALAGQKPPPTADPKALTSASLRAKFRATRSALALQPLELGLDGARLRGKLRIPDLSHRAVAFDLAVDDLDVDRYLPPPAAAKPAAKSPSAGGAATPGAAAGAAMKLPVDQLRALDVAGRFRAGRLKVAGVSLAKVDASVKAKGGLIELKPLSAQLYGGTYSGGASLDVRGERTALVVDERFQGVRADRLVKALGIEPGVDLAGGASSLRLRAKATGDTERQSFQFEELALGADLAGKDFPGGRLKFDLSTDAALDLSRQTFAAKKLTLDFAGMKLVAALEANGILGAPTYAARVSTAPFNPRTLLGALGQKPPPTADPKALTSATLSLEAKGSTTSIDIGKLDAKLDQSRLTGKLAVANFAAPAIRFDLKLDAIDADRYLPPPPKGGSPAAGGGTKAKGQPATPGAAAALLPVDLLRALDVDGQLVVGKLKVNDVRMSNVRLTARAKDGLVSLHPLGAKLYQGAYDGNVRIDARGKQPRISVDEKLTGVQAGPLLEDVSGRKTLTGLANASAKLEAFATDERTLRRTLTGNAQVRFTDGTIEGINLLALICRGLQGLGGLTGAAGGQLDAKSLIGGVIGQITGAPGGGGRAGGKTQGAGARTEFAELSGSLLVNQGLASNDDLAMKSPLLRVSGEGKIDLVNERADYLARAALVSSCEGQGGKDLGDLAGLTIPVRIKGPLAKLSYEPDFSGVLQALAGSRKRATTQPAAATRAAPTPAVPTAPTAPAAPSQARKPTAPKDQVKEAVEGLLKGGLKGLFGQ